MKRAPVVLTATAAGLAATLGFHAHRPSASPAAAVATTTTATTAATAKSSTAKRSRTASSVKTGTGEANTRYGIVQLKVTVSGGKIKDVEALQLPSQDPKSQQISGYAAPQLRQSALSKQSANIDAVSGATYTSAGYQTALQAALDHAGFSGATGNGASG